MYYFLVDLFSPFTLLCLFLLLAALNLWRWRVESKRRLLLVTVPIVTLFILCTSVAAYWAAGLLEWSYPTLETIPADVDAIVVLGGGIREATSTLPDAELAENTRFRCIYAAELYKKRPMPILVTGGIVETNLDVPPLAPLMKELLIERGVPARDILVEDASSTTFENAELSQPILAEFGARHILLVTDASHMMRASRCFTAYDLDVTPAPCRHSTEVFHWRPESFLPRAGAARSVRRSMHEWLGMLWYQVSGKT
jgi:uncharacterized SAM-binding protein YcdF (DUF218 family)